MVFLTHGSRLHFYKFSGCWPVGQGEACWALDRDLLPYLNHHDHPIVSLMVQWWCYPTTSLQLPWTDWWLPLYQSPWSHCKRLSEVPSLWLDYWHWVWVFRIPGRTCFSAASMPDGQSGPNRTGELARASLVGSSRVGGVLCPQLRAKYRAGTQQILVEFNTCLFNRKDVFNSLTLSS